MIKKISIAAICLMTSLPALSLPLNPGFEVNFKKAYCNNQEFLGNAATKRPHLHCDGTFISYKKSNSDHSNITEMGNCKRTNEVFEHIKANKSAFADYQAIYNTLVAYHQADCPNQ